MYCIFGFQYGHLQTFGGEKMVSFNLVYLPVRAAIHFAFDFMAQLDLICIKVVGKGHIMISVVYQTCFGCFVVGVLNHLLTNSVIACVKSPDAFY